MKMPIDAQTRKLITHLGRGGVHSYWWTMPARRSTWWPVSDPAPLPANEENIYFGVHPVGEIPPTNSGGEKRAPEAVRSQIDYIAAVNCLFAEFDAKDFEDGIDGALTHVDELTLPPSVVIFSGGGYHAYWLLDEPFVLATDEDRKRAQDLQRRWVAMVGGDDGAKDLARVLRVPGTKNHKPAYGPEFPTVEIIRFDLSILYNLATLEGLLPPVEASAPPAAHTVGHRATQAANGAGKRYAQVARDKELDALAKAAEGGRNDQLNKSSFALGQLIAAGGLDETETVDMLQTTAQAIGLGEGEARRTIKSGITAGMEEPRVIPPLYERRNGDGPPQIEEPPGWMDEDAIQEKKPATQLPSLVAGLKEAKDPEAYAISIIDQAARLASADRLRLRSALKAAGLSARWLDTQWKPAVKETAKKEQRRAMLAGDTEGRYSVQYGVIAERSESTGADGEPTVAYIPLCNFEALIEADVIKDDGQTESLHLAIHSEQFGDALIPAADFEAMKWVVSEFGARAAIEPGRGTRDRLRHAIQILSEEAGIGRRRVYTHTGWRKVDGQRVFLTANGGLNMPNVEVDLPPDLQRYALPSDLADRDQAADMRQSLALLDVASDAVTMPLYAAMFLAPLAEIIPPKFVLWIEGESGSLKTTMASLFMAHYGAFDDDHVPTSWEGTANSLERLAFHAKDVPLLIDDFRPGASRYESERMQKAADRVIRAAGNRQGRSRLNADSSLKMTYPPRGLVISTAEIGTLGVSTTARTLRILQTRDDVRLPALTTAQGATEALRYAMAGYLQWLGENYDAIDKDAKKWVQKLRDAQAGNGHKRLPAQLATLMAGFTSATRYGVAVRAITKDEADALDRRCFAALKRASDAQAELVESQDPALEAIQTLATLASSGNIRINNRATGEVVYGGTDGELVGWIDGEVIYLTSAAHKEITRFTRESGGHFGATAVEMNRALDRAGFVTKRTSERRIGVLTRLPDGGRKRVLHIDAAKFEETVQNMGFDLAMVKKRGKAI